jgi:hypothetical protein
MFDMNEIKKWEAVSATGDDPLVVVDTESAPNEVVGTFVGRHEDSVIYETRHGHRCIAPADCVRVMFQSDVIYTSRGAEDRRDYLRRAAAYAVENVEDAILNGLDGMSALGVNTYKGRDYFPTDDDLHWIPGSIIVYFKDGIGIKVTVEIDHLPEGVKL